MIDWQTLTTYLNGGFDYAQPTDCGLAQTKGANKIRSLSKANRSLSESN